MNVTMDRKALVDALRIVMPAALRTGHSMPVLGGVRLDVGATTVHVTATNLDLTIYTETEADWGNAQHDPGVAIVPAHLLLNVASNMAGDLVTLAEMPDGATLEVSSVGTLARLRMFATDTWPQITEPLGAPVVLDGAALGALAEASRFVSVEQSHGTHTGVYFGPEGIMATDRYRAMLYSDGTEYAEAIVPAAAVLAVVKEADDEVAFTADGNQASFTVGATTWVTSLLSGDYPRAGLITAMSAEPEAVISCATDDLRRSLARIASLGDTRVTLTPMDGDLVLTSRADDVGDISDVIPATIDTQEWVTYETAKLLALVDAVADDDIGLGLPGPRKPTVVRSGDLSMLLAPLKPTA